MSDRPPDDPADFHIGRHRPAQGTRAGSSAIVRAQNFVGIVRDEGTDAIGAYLDNLNRTDLYALTVALAAMVPHDRTPAELLAWIDGPTLPLEEPA